MTIEQMIDPTMRPATLALFPLAILAGCSGGKDTAPPATASTVLARDAGHDRPSAAAARPPLSRRGLEEVIGKDGEALIRLFGNPRLNVQEANGRKLQFTGTACILDAYLYSEAGDRTERVTHIDARRRDGAEVDRAACVNALIKR